MAQKKTSTSKKQSPDPVSIFGGITCDGMSSAASLFGCFAIILALIHHINVVAATINIATYGSSPLGQFAQEFAIIFGVVALVIYFRIIHRGPDAAANRQNLALLGLLVVIVIVFIVFKIGQAIP